MNHFNEQFQISDAELAALNTEADAIQEYMDRASDIRDGNVLTERLHTLDTYMSRLSEMMIRAKTMKAQEQNAYLAANEEKINKLTATVSNRMLASHLFEHSATYERLETMYHTVEHLTRDLVTQISYLKKQLESFGA